MRVLVASHDASRTGAPLLLLTFLSWLRRETDAEVQLVLWRGGPLVEAFAEVAEVTVLHPPPGRRSKPTASPRPAASAPPWSEPMRRVVWL